jgi:hypothetical protein
VKERVIPCHRRRLWSSAWFLLTGVMRSDDSTKITIETIEALVSENVAVCAG